MKIITNYANQINFKSNATPSSDSTDKKGSKNILKNSILGTGVGFSLGIFASALIDSCDISGNLLKKTWVGGTIAGLATGLLVGISKNFASDNDKTPILVGGLGYGATFGSLAGLVLRETLEAEKKFTSKKAACIGGIIGACLGGLIALSIKGNTQKQG